MTKEEQQTRATLNDHIVIHKVTDTILAMHKDGTEVYAVEIVRKPLVRCKDCKYGEYRADYDDYECNASGCGLVYDAEYFCAEGEREGE